ncbi:MAG: PspC domain-containing protein [Bacteroidales bacterium]|nr:PspC domain-containing protein [Bacteroidales bacterium]
MKKTVSVNLGGIAFVIDEDAYEILQNYFAKLNARYPNSDESEIIRDIEERLAEILRENRDRQRKEVVDAADVRAVIETMGQPDEFDDEKSDASCSSPSENTKEVKRLYRDTRNSLIAGVCAGQAAYLNVDAIWVRLAWVILLFSPISFVLLAYILFWIIVPEAKNAEHEPSGRKRTVAADILLASLALFVVLPSLIFLLFFFLPMVCFTHGFGVSGSIGIGFLLLTLCPLAALVVMAFQLRGNRKRGNAGSSKKYWLIYLLLFLLWIAGAVCLCSGNGSSFDQFGLNIDESGISIENDGKQIVIDDKGINIGNETKDSVEIALESDSIIPNLMNE